jgi:hypothetical protein
MATLKTRIVLVLALLFSIHYGLQGNIAHRRCIAETYTSQIGIHEATGKNDGSVVESYQKAAGIHKGDAWCAAFVTWCFEQCGIATAVTWPAWSPSWFTKNIVWKQAKGSTPQQADVFGIWFQRKKRIAHVGFIDNWNQSDKCVMTVEGNTNEAGSREGDGVYRKRRLKSQIYAVASYINE